MDQDNNFLQDMIKKIYDRVEVVDNKVDSLEEWAQKIELHLQKLNGQQVRNTQDIDYLKTVTTALEKFSWKVTGGIIVGVSLVQLFFQFFPW